MADIHVDLLAIDMAVGLNWLHPAQKNRDEPWAQAIRDKHRAKWLAEQKTERRKDFDPDEPRDEEGRWTDGGGSERESEDVSEFDSGAQIAGHGDTRPGVGMYAGLGNSFTMNEALRTNTVKELGPELRKAIDDLTDEIDKSVTTADRVISRGLHGWASIEKFTRPGTIVKDNGFMSATRDESWAKRMFASSPSYDGAVINILVPKGSKMMTVARSSEDEVILPRGTSLRIKDAKVLSRRPDGSRDWQISAEVV